MLYLKGLVLILQVILLIVLIVVLFSEKKGNKRRVRNLYIVSIILALIIAVLCIFTSNLISIALNIIIVGMSIYNVTEL